VSNEEIGALADEVHRAAMAYWNTRPRNPAGLYSMSELAEPSDENMQAYEALRELGRRLASHDQGNIMSQVYDEAVERYGYEGVRGANHVWTGIGEWMGMSGKVVPLRPKKQLPPAYLPGRRAELAREGQRLREQLRRSLALEDEPEPPEAA